MKKLLLIPLLFVCFVLSGQRIFLYDSIVFPLGSDTTVYWMFYSNDNWSLQFNYSALDESDDLLDLGGADVNDGSVFDRLDDLRLPWTLLDSTVAFEKSNYSYRYLCIKFTPVSSGSGTIYYRLIKR